MVTQWVAVAATIAGGSCVEEMPVAPLVLPAGQAPAAQSNVWFMLHCPYLYVNAVACPKHPVPTKAVCVKTLFVSSQNWSLTDSAPKSTQGLPAVDCTDHFCAAPVSLQSPVV
eukprot:CAMPEP_0175211504 /NCGR_PEP_ID=MMETSP0093-20121207/15194_1 /TAXON_ID=311494 /ORGANISM="Alexandrium monilatum, Strain CCMP3105" /LENGTH=112 /DNA_ID=CAMNT_0016504765 /DNA_START=128 /DNA_END=466 /DNA_ORIENTATION=-